MEKRKRDFDYDFAEIESEGTKIIFISDEKTNVVRPTDIHMHSFWELFYLQNGTLTVNGENSKITLTKNEALIIPPKTYHNSVPEQNTVKKSIFFTFEHTLESESSELFSALYSTFSSCGFYKIGDDSTIGILLGNILENIASNRIGKDLRIKSAVIDLIFHLYDTIDERFKSNSLFPSQKSSYWAYNYEIDRLIDAYYTNDVTLDLLSQKLFISTQSIKRIISSVYGKGFNELKLELKMRNAKRLLLETDMTINEIAEETGYGSMRGFLTAFEKYEGITPTEYRKK